MGTKRNTLVVFLLIIVAIMGCEGAKKIPTEFDRQVWIAAKGDPNPIRQTMVKSLENKIQIGMSTKDIITLMGEPDYETDSGSEKYYIYYLGRGLIDYEEFRVIFDSNSQVVNFMQLQG